MPLVFLDGIVGRGQAIRRAVDYAPTREDDVFPGNRETAGAAISPTKQVSEESVGTSTGVM